MCDQPRSTDTADAAERYESLYMAVVSHMHHRLKPHRFRKFGTLFRCEGRVTNAFVAFQKTAWGVRGEPVHFTVNAGIFVRELANSPAERGSRSHWHWVARPGRVLGRNKDWWVTVEDASDVTQACNELDEAYDDAFVKLLKDAQSPAAVARVVRIAPSLVSLDFRRWLGGAAEDTSVEHRAGP